MRVLLIGSRGSIGRRYMSILNYLGIEVEGYDTLDHGHVIRDFHNEHDDSFDKAIIASPTLTHYFYCKKLLEMNKPFLVEKPLSRFPGECADLIALDKNKLGRIVCNYLYALDGHKPAFYDYYNTGGDGVLWDLSQLIYMNPKIEISTRSPIWKLMRDDGVRVTYDELESSYIFMVKDFLDVDNLGHADRLWTLEDGLRMTEAVRLREIDEIQMNEHRGMEGENP